MLNLQAAGPLDLIEWVKLASSLPLTALLIMVLVGGSMGWWIYGTIHKTEIAEMTAQRDKALAEVKAWQDRYLEQMKGR